MINKKQLAKQSIKIIESNNILSKQKNQKLESLKKLIPEIVNADGQLNTQALHDFIDISQTTSNNKGYELTFAGKGIARAMAATETTKELKVEKAQSKNFDSTENVVIRGDNLEVLKILKQNYFEKIKMIYIDPPYNTTSEDFIYNDNFKQSEEELIQNLGLGEETSNFLHNVYGTRSHSGWLAFMYPRLKLARDLLRDDGVIFISIDDNEQANLKIMCDEIFGEGNFVGEFVWKTKQAARGVPPVTMMMNNHEYITCYAKAKNDFKFLGIERNKNDFDNPDNDKRGLWRSESMSATGSQNNIFTVKNPDTGDEFTKNWAFSYQKIQQMIQENLILFPLSPEGTPRQKKFFNSYKNELKAFVSDLGWFSTENSTKQLMNIFQDRKLFDFPKPIDLVKFLVNQSAIFTNDLILDFFAGSGTTGDAVMQLNAEDGGNRKYILVQWDEAIAENTEAHKFCTENNFEPVISSICIERLNRAGEKIRQEQKAKNGMFDDEKLDIGYKVFSLTKKQKIIETTENNQSLFQLENKRTSTENTLYNMLCATRKSLDTKIQEIIKDKLYQADDELYLLSTITSEELEPYKDHKINIDGYSDISLEQWLNLDVVNKENINVVY